MNLLTYPHPSGRRVVLGRRAALAASQPLAVAAGFELLHQDGNAVGAAVAMAAALVVVESTSNGLGGDAFALLRVGPRMLGLNASGKSPQGLDPVPYLWAGRLPRFGWDVVTVLGAGGAARAFGSPLPCRGPGAGDPLGGGGFSR